MQAAPPPRDQPRQAPPPKQAEPSRPAPTAPQASSPSSDVDLSSPAAVWAELLKRIESVSSFAWVDKVTLGAIDTEAGTAKIHPRPGQGEIAKFTGSRQLERLAAELSEIVGRTMRVTLDAPASRPDASTQHSGGKPGMDMTVRQKAIGLPLVKDILDAFPDAVLMDARREEQEDEAAEEDESD